VPQVTRYPTMHAPRGRLAEIRHVLDTAFAGDFTDADWEHALGGTHAVISDLGRVVAHAAVVPRTIWVGERELPAGYVEAVGTDPSVQGTGLGSLLMETVAAELREKYELGALSTGAPAFFERLGWERWQGPTFVRRGAERIRTPDEDDGVMVLRFGPSATVDLTEPIACETRPGDDW
jgi:aminoglycoside 2'-N-acetyltransferase I